MTNPIPLDPAPLASGLTGVPGTGGAGICTVHIQNYVNPDGTPIPRPDEPPTES